MEPRNVDTLEDEPTPGQFAAPGTPPPAGWAMVHMGEGQYELWPKAPDDFDPEARMKVLSRLDDAYDKAMKPTEEDKTPTPPEEIIVNKKFAEMFHMRRYRESQISVTDDARKVPGNAPQFKFVFAPKEQGAP